MIISALVTTTIMAGFLLPATPHDLDADGLNDIQETYIYHTDPNLRDTDGDGYADGIEIKYGFSPLHGNNKKLSEVDTDSDGLNDELELALGSNLNSPDSDGDGHLDGEEVLSGWNPSAGLETRDVARRILVNRSTQSLDYFLNGIKIGTIPVSTGLRATETPLGEFRITRKAPVVHYIGPGYNLPNTKWNLEFKRSYYIHGAYWHNQFGIRPMSHGCVNVSYKDVEALYKFAQVGDKVEIIGETPKGKVNVALAR